MITKQDNFNLNANRSTSQHLENTPQFSWNPMNMLIFFNQRVEKWRSRKQLEELSEHHLRDIGITREDALKEASKPFWRD